jgi:hypothetical protein
MLPLLLLAGTLLGPAAAEVFQRVPCDPTTQDIYGFNATLLSGNETVQFSEFAGKVVLVYNLATY